MLSTFETELMAARTNARNHFTTYFPTNRQQVERLLDESLTMLLNNLAEPIRAARGILHQSECTICKQALKELMHVPFDT